MYFLSHHAAFVTRSPVFNLARRNLFCSKALPHSWECPKSNRTLLGEASSESSRGGKDEMWSVWSHSPEPGVEGGQWGGRPRSIQEENAQHPELVVDRSPLPRDVQAGGVSTSPPPRPSDVDRGGQHWWESWTLTWRAPCHEDPVRQTPLSSRASSHFSLVNRPVSVCQVTFHSTVHL